MSVFQHFERGTTEAHRSDAASAPEIDLITRFCKYADTCDYETGVRQKIFFDMLTHIDTSLFRTEQIC